MKILVDSASLGCNTAMTKTTKSPKTLDGMALELLLKGDQTGLTRLAEQASDIASNKVPCPECGDKGPHEDNGEMGAGKTLCCRKCGNHFDVYEG